MSIPGKRRISPGSESKKLWKQLRTTNAYFDQEKSPKISLTFSWEPETHIVPIMIDSLSSPELKEPELDLQTPRSWHCERQSEIELRWRDSYRRKDIQQELCESDIDLYSSRERENSRSMKFSKLQRSKSTMSKRQLMKWNSENGHWQIRKREEWGCKQPSQSSTTQEQLAYSQMLEKRLREKNNKLQKRATVAEDKVMTLATKLSTVEELLLENRNEISRALAQDQRLQKELCTLKDENKAFRELTKHQSEEIKGLREELFRSNHQLSLYEKSISELEKQLEFATRKLNEFKRKHKEQQKYPEKLKCSVNIPQISQPSGEEFSHYLSTIPLVTANVYSPVSSSRCTSLSTPGNHGNGEVCKQDSDDNAHVDREEPFNWGEEPEMGLWDTQKKEVASTTPRLISLSLIKTPEADPSDIGEVPWFGSSKVGLNQVDDFKNDKEQRIADLNFGATRNIVGKQFLELESLVLSPRTQIHSRKVDQKEKDTSVPLNGIESLISNNLAHKTTTVSRQSCSGSSYNPPTYFGTNLNTRSNPSLSSQVPLDPQPMTLDDQEADDDVEMLKQKIHSLECVHQSMEVELTQKLRLVTEKQFIQKARVSTLEEELRGRDKLLTKKTMQIEKLCKRAARYKAKLKACGVKGSEKAVNRQCAITRSIADKRSQSCSPALTRKDCGKTTTKYSSHHKWDQEETHKDVPWGGSEDQNPKYKTSSSLRKEVDKLRHLLFERGESEGKMLNCDINLALETIEKKHRDLFKILMQHEESVGLMVQKFQKRTIELKYFVADSCPDVCFHQYNLKSMALRQCIKSMDKKRKELSHKLCQAQKELNYEMRGLAKLNAQESHPGTKKYSNYSDKVAMMENNSHSNTQSLNGDIVPGAVDDCLSVSQAYTHDTLSRESADLKEYISRASRHRSNLAQQNESTSEEYEFDHETSLYIVKDGAFRVLRKENAGSDSRSYRHPVVNTTNYYHNENFSPRSSSRAPSHSSRIQRKSRNKKHRKRRTRNELD